MQIKYVMLQAMRGWTDLFGDDAELFLIDKQSGIQGLLSPLHKDFHEAILNSVVQHSGDSAYYIMQTTGECNMDKKGKLHYTRKRYSFKDVDLGYEQEGMM